MKKFIFLFLIMVPFLGLGQIRVSNQPVDTHEEEKPSIEKTTIEFTEEVYEFGEVTAGEKVTHTFKFKNTGKVPLIISTAKASCGCTVAATPKEPIPPGESDEIQVVFNTTGKSGQQTKYVDVVANTEPMAITRILMKGTVLVADASDD